MGRPQRWCSAGEGASACQRAGGRSGGPWEAPPWVAWGLAQPAGAQKANQSTEVGPTAKFGPKGRAVQKAAQRLRPGSLAQRWEQMGA